MKIIVFVMCVCFVLPMQPDDMERYAYCEICLTAARDIEEAMKKAPAESRQRVMESLIAGSVCEKLVPNKQIHISTDQMTSSCMHLLDSHYDQFRVALLSREPKHLDIVLCYEQSRACMGVKRTSFEDAKKRTFTDGDIEALLLENKENVRIARPSHPGLPVHSEDEL